MKLPRVICARRELPDFGAGFAEGFWQEIGPLELVENGAGGAPMQATQVRMAWDVVEWRLCFEMEDREPWATLTARDAALYEEEVVEVFVDPVGDLLGYFEIEVNPLNAICDLALRKVRSGWRKDFAWDCEGLQTRAELTASGWRVEMGIPFGAIAAGPPEAGDCWRANFLRIDQPRGQPRELSAWSPTGMANFHVQERFGVVEFCG